ncbi:MAG TPA: hypothetical protein VK914_01550 [bacterium]|jgi:hypothetical protein|nr:hypothetical protein [bacterium]
MDDKQFVVVSKKLDIIIRLLARQHIGDKSGRDAIKTLSALGFQPKEIADLIGTTSNTVSVALNSLKKNKNKKKVKK